MIRHDLKGAFVITLLIAERTGFSHLIYLRDPNSKIDCEVLASECRNYEPVIEYLRFCDPPAFLAQMVTRST